MLHVFSDAFEQAAMTAIVYLRTKDSDNKYHVCFVLGKAKVAPTHGHVIPRLKLCTAVIAVQITDIVTDELDFQPGKIKFYTESQVVLGYIHNQSKLFYKYVENRIERIRKTTEPLQWSYVQTNVNPADAATRTIHAETLHNSIWILGQPQHLDTDTEDSGEDYPLLEPENDSEIRLNTTNVKVLKLSVENKTDVTFKICHRIKRFSDWKALVKTIDRLRNIAKKNQRNIDSDKKIVHLSEEWMIQMTQRGIFVAN